jgi:hypothetical protein
MKQNKLDISIDLLKQWTSAQISAGYGRFYGLSVFKAEHPKEFKHLQGMSNKRKEINTAIDIMSCLGAVHWITLTFDMLKDKNKEQTKRKLAWNLLNKYCGAVLMVEEYGEDNGRYHIHALGTWRNYDLKYTDFYKDWSSRSTIEKLETWKYRKKAKYLTKYVVKDIPRIRRNKVLLQAQKHYKKYMSMKNYGFNGIANEHYNDMLCDYTMSLGLLPF